MFTTKIKKKGGCSIPVIVTDESLPVWRQKWTAAEAVAADTDGIFDGITCDDEEAVTATPEDITFKVQPAAARNITATAGGTAADIKAVAVKITGTDCNGLPLTETLPVFTADTAGSVTGSKAFATVTGVEIPAMDGAGVTVDIGWGDKLGLDRAVSALYHLVTYLDGTVEETAPTFTVSATDLAANTIDLNSALAGKTVETIYIVR